MAKSRCAVCASASRKAENVARYTLAPCVEGELLAIWKTIATDNPAAASRVVEAAYETFAMLAEHPELGRKRTFQNPRVRGVHSWRISGFDNYLIFYRPIPDGVQVLHVYHGARHLENLFRRA